MGEYYAWAATGIVAEYEAWSEADFGSDGEGFAEENGAVRIASELVQRQKFYLRQPGDRDVEVNLVGSTLPLRDGHAVTAVWAAHRGAAHGYCVHLENHTTGAEIRLPHNIKNIRVKVSAARAAKFGSLATIPAALALLLWLLIPGALDDVDMNLFFLGVTAAFVVLFVLGGVMAKVVLDYLQADDDRKIWVAVEDVLAEIRAGIRQRQKSRTRR
jgi:hypothetical protein